MTRHADGEAARILEVRARVLRELPPVAVRVPGAPWLIGGYAPARVKGGVLERE